VDPDVRNASNETPLFLAARLAARMGKSHLDLLISCQENPMSNPLKFLDLDGKILEKIPPWMRISIRML